MENLWVRCKLIDTEKHQEFFKFISFIFSKAFVFPAFFLFFTFDIIFLILYFFTSWGKHLVYYSSLDYFLMSFYSFITIWLHEIGHISAAKKYGAKTGGIGFGIYYYFIVAYADVRETWNLPMYQRRVVSIAGFYCNIIATIPLFILVFWLNSKTIADFLLLFHILFIYTFNPFLKMDGYWFLCDVLGVPNLQTRIKIYFVSIFTFKTF